MNRSAPYHQLQRGQFDRTPRYASSSNSLAISERLSVESQQRRQEKRRRLTEAFLKGPISLPWLATAARLGGKSLHVAIAIQFHAGLGVPQNIRVRSSTLHRLGVGRKAYYRALTVLESAGLIKTQKGRGKMSAVTIIHHSPATLPQADVVDVEA